LGPTGEVTGCDWRAIQMRGDLTDHDECNFGIREDAKQLSNFWWVGLRAHTA
jgi:hypothetical protein